MRSKMVIRLTPHGVFYCAGWYQSRHLSGVSNISDAVSAVLAEFEGYGYEVMAIDHTTQRAVLVS